MNNHTPRTDAAEINAFTSGIPPRGFYVTADFARQLERELAEATEYADETHARHQGLVEQVAQLKNENAALSEELKAQCVVNGIGGSREAKLLAEMDKLRADNAALREALEAIANASGFDNIGNWARNKARAAIDAARKTP